MKFKVGDKIRCLDHGSKQIWLVEKVQESSYLVSQAHSPSRGFLFFDREHDFELVEKIQKTHPLTKIFQ
jgi:hypothetical protein